MKLSKKLVAIVLTAALVIAQVSVLPFALENPYASGKSDSASYAMRVPTDEKLAYAGTGWFKSTTSILRNADNTGYATTATSTTGAFLYTQQIGDERFFVVTPASSAAKDTLNIRFSSNPYYTYTSEASRPYNGIPDSISSTMEGMAFRVKGAGTAADKMYLNIAVAAQGNGNNAAHFAYVATSNLVFYDVATGAQTALTYDTTNGGILLPGNADGYIYAPLTGMLKGTEALTYEILTADYKTTNSGNNKGYRGIRYAFGTTDFNGKTLYIGDAFFVEDIDAFELVHSAPKAPVLASATETSIQVDAVAGVVYAIDKGNGVGEYSASGLFEELEEGTTYTIYAKFDKEGAVFVSSSKIATKGLLVPTASEITHNSIKINVIAGQEYSIDGVNFDTVGVYTDLETETTYTITTRDAANPANTKTATFTTEKQPFSHVKGDGAYYALKAPVDATKIDSSFIAASENFGDIVVENGAIVFAPLSAEKATVAIRGSKLTYGGVSGVSDKIPNRDGIQAVAVRLKVTGTVAANAKVGFAFGEYKLADGNYAFINVADRKQTTVYSYGGMLEIKGALDGFIIIPIDKFETEKDKYSAAKLKTGYITFDVAMEGDWANSKFVVDYALFLTDTVKFVSSNAFPAEPAIIERGKEYIKFVPEKGVVYSLTEGNTWTGADFTGEMTGLSVGQTYPIWAKFEGSEDILKTSVSTRPQSVTLVAPVIKGTTTNKITVVYVPDHEYSIEGTDEWNRTGVFENVGSGVEYYIVSRVVEETEVSAPVKAVTLDGKYSSDNKDGSTYLYRVPNTDLSGNELPKIGSSYSYITKALGANGIGAGIGRLPTSVNTSADGDHDGAYLIREFDGEKFIQFTPYEQSEASSVLYPDMPYNGAKFYDAAAVGRGLLRAAGVVSIEAIAVRVKINNISDPVGATFYINANVEAGHAAPTDKVDYSFIDAVTGETSNIGFKNGAINFEKPSYDGWVIIPFELYKSNGITLDGMLDSYSSVKVNVHGTDCSHGASWSKWASNTEFYMGETVVISDMTNFIYGNTMPATPVYDVKTATTIDMVTEYGMEYSLDKLTWNMNGKFTGLTPDTKYTVYARYRNRDLMSSLDISTDMTNPPMEAPELVSVTDIEIVVKAYGGLEYSYDKENWNETGVFYGVAPNTEFKIYGRNKVTGEMTPALEVKTPKADNPYLNEDGFTSKWFDMSRYDGQDKYNEYWIGEHVYVYNESTGSYDVQHSPAGKLDIITEDGERFINYCLQENGGKKTGTSFIIEGRNTYGVKAGFPRGIWVEQCWGFAIRMKIDQTDQDLKIRWFTNSKALGQAHFTGGATYYLIDKKAGTWEKKAATNYIDMRGFDGWMIIPFNQLKMSMEDIQNGFYTVEPFTHAMSEGSSWVGVRFLVGDSVIVHDAQKFADKYAPNTEMQIAATARNEMTDTTIPAIMANDCGSLELGGGLVEADKTKQEIVKITKPNEKSDAISIRPAFDTFSKIKLQNDSLNYKVPPEEIKNQVLDTLGAAFYVEVPEKAPGKIGFNFEICEQMTEIFVNSPDASYYTITGGKMYEHYGKIELRPGFKGYLLFNFETFDVVYESSEVIDGLLFSPQSIDYFALEFDALEYPALNQTEIIIDDLMLWQDLEAFAKSILKIQGSDVYEITEVYNNFRNDDSDLPRFMANDGTGIELEEGIYSMSNVKLSLVEIPGTADTYVNIKIGEGNSNVMFGNFAIYEDQAPDEVDSINITEGITFTVDIPKTAPSIIGMDFELLENNEDYLEYHVYDANKFYYTIDENAVVTKVFGYLEFNPGFKGQVIIPFKNFYFDEDYSDYYDGELLNPESIEYFGFYFSTAYYAAIGGAEFGVDSLAYYDGYALDYIDAIWKQITKDGTIIPQNVKAAATAQSLEARTIALKANPASSEVAFPLLTVISLAVLSSALIVISRKRREED